MKTISEYLSERRAERRKDYFLPALAFILGAILMTLAAAVIGVVILKTAGIVEDAQARAYCEGAICAGPAW